MRGGIRAHVRWNKGSCEVELSMSVMLVVPIVKRFSGRKKIGLGFLFLFL